MKIRAIHGHIHVTPRWLGSVASYLALLLTFGISACNSGGEAEVDTEAENESIDEAPAETTPNVLNEGEPATANTTGFVVLSEERRNNLTSETNSQPNATAPTAQVDGGEAVISGTLTTDQVNRVIARHGRGFRYCYERDLRRSPDLEGLLVVNWTVDSEGQVSQRQIENDSMRNRNVQSCLLREVGRMRFPRPEEGTVTVTYPFHFHPESGVEEGATE